MATHPELHLITAEQFLQIDLIDPETETVRSVTRTGPHNWTDNLHGAGEDIAVPCLDIALPHAEIFAR